MTTNQAVIATTPSAMVAAQGTMIAWGEKKLGAVADEMRDADALLAQLRLARMSTAHADRTIASLRRRQRFYDKVKAALQADYYIIPPFDCQIFALRTDRASPPQDTSRVRNPRNDAHVPALPAGQGAYVHPVPARALAFEDTQKQGDKEVAVPYFQNTDWNDVEFPIIAMKPELVEAAHKALELRIFDALGIMPQYRAADPIIVGQIKHYKAYQGPLTFFVAWWMDYDQL